MPEVMTKSEVEKFLAETYERNKETLQIVHEAIFRFGGTAESPVVRHLMDAEAYLQREIMGHELARLKNNAYPA